MEYELDFIRALLGDSIKVAGGPDLRKDLRARRYDPSRELRDIVGLMIGLEPRDAQRLRSELEVYGYAVTSSPAGFRALGPDIFIEVIEDRVRSSIRELHLTLRAAPGERSHSFGDASRLLLADTTAV
jgi:hypothetical protein